MKLLWSRTASAEYAYWEHADRRVFEKINALIEDVQRTPFTGLGKPEPLKHQLAGAWSRRITGRHRLVYMVEGKGKAAELQIVKCRFHY